MFSQLIPGAGAWPEMFKKNVWRLHTVRYSCHLPNHHTVAGTTSVFSLQLHDKPLRKYKSKLAIDNNLALTTKSKMVRGEMMASYLPCLFAMRMSFTTIIKELKEYAPDIHSST